MVAEYPTVTATIVRLSSSAQRGAITKALQDHYSMSAEDAANALNNLPFRLPRSFFSVKDGQSSVRSLIENGCEIKLRDMMDPEPEEEEESEPEPQPVIEEPPRPKIVQSDMAVKKPEEKKKKGFKINEKVVMALGGVVIGLVVALVVTMIVMAPPSGDSENRAAADALSEEERRIFHTPFLQRLATSINEQLNKLQSMEGFLESVSDQLDENQVSEPDREVISDHYSNKAMRPRAKDSRHIRTMRSIQMLEVALAINPRNTKAWSQLVEVYQDSGMSHRAKVKQKAMLVAVGEEEMAEIYGMELVQELLK